MDSDQAWDIGFEGLSVGYGQHTVLSELNCTLKAGQISVLLGESGCGKSTLLKHIIGLSRPIRGTIKIGQVSIADCSEAMLRKMRRRMGVLFQDGALLGALTVAQNVALPLSEHLDLSASELRREALRVLEMVELAEFCDFYPNQLSGGMRKRAGLARAIITRPKILLCDEPTSGLDPITAARMDQLLCTLHTQYPEMTIVSVSHDLASVQAIADWVVMLRAGHCLFEGSKEALLASQDPYLQQFLTRSVQGVQADVAVGMEPAVAKALEQWLEQ